MSKKQQQQQQASTEAAMDPMAAFYTADAANEGVQAPLYAPGGIKTAHWLRLRSVDSDAYRLAVLGGNREGTRIAQLKTQEEKDRATLELTTKLAASLVCGWSFEQPCTTENVVAFLQKAPQVEQMIENIAGSRSLFFALRSSSSELMQKQSSSST